MDDSKPLRADPRARAREGFPADGSPTPDTTRPGAEELRRLGPALIEMMAEAVEAELEEPVLRPISGLESKALFDEPLPEEPTAAEEVMATWRERIIPYCRRNGHPRFFGYVCTSADPMGMLADGLAASLNQPVTAWRSSPPATEMERLVLRWLDAFVGFGSGGQGLLVSGGSAANFHALAAAVMAREGEEENETGRQHLSAYLSRECHVSMRKALRLLGLPTAGVRLLPVDSQRRLSLPALEEAIRDDRAAGRMPALIVASAGTANTGTIDPLDEIADIARREDLWLHIDGAYGAPAAATEAHGSMRRAFARADSLSLDPHKWLYTPVDAGCVLMRDEGALRRAFSMGSEYTEVSQTGSIESYAFFDHGLEMTRRFRGLKIWSILKTRGARQIRDWIAGNIHLREYLDQRILSEPRLELLGSGLGISCFRYRPECDGDPEDVDPARLDNINRQILETLVREGKTYMSPTGLDGCLSLRVSIVSFRTRRSDLDFLIDEVLRLGQAQGGP